MFALFAFFLFFADDKPPSGTLDAELKRFIDVFATIEANAADPINPAQTLYQGAIPGMLRRLDPHSVFFDPGHFEQLKELENSVRKGFGSVVSILPGRVIVLQALPGTPSAKAGLTAGDEILAVNNIALARLDMDQLIGLLQESRQRQAKLDVRRPGNSRILPILLTPEEMDAPSVERAFLLKDGIGYLRVGSFDAKTGAEIRDAIEKLGGDALKGLLLDLRNNPGGVLNAAVDTAALFLEPGKKIVSVRGRSVQASEATVPANAKPYKFPLAILMNGKSASASEIVAGAVRDHKRGSIVGEPSYGKGLVQSVYPLAQNSGLALTTAFYYTPNGQSIQRRLQQGQLVETTAAGDLGGIQPDQLVYPEPTSRLRAVVEASASLSSFATDFLSRNRGVGADFEVTNLILDEFQRFLAQRNIQPGLAEWGTEREWIRKRLKQEIFNQSLGVDKGDEVEARSDPVVRAALKTMGAEL